MKDIEKTKDQLIWELKKLRQQVALDNHTKEQEFSHINQVMQTVNTTINLDEVVEKVMLALADIFNFNQISIYLFNAETSSLEVTYWYGEHVTDEIREMFESHPLSIEWEEVYFVRAFLDNEPQYVSPITEKLLTYYSERDRQMFDWNPHKSIAIYPLEVQGKVIGVINFVNTAEAFTLNEENFNRVKRYVGQIAATINNAYLVRKTRFALQQAQEKEKEIAHLNQLIQTTNATLDFDEVFNAILNGLKDVFEFEAIGIQLVDEEQKLLNIYKVYGDMIEPHHVKKWRALQISATSNESVSSYVFGTGEPAYFPKITPDMPFAPIDLKIFEIHPFSAYLAFPLMVQGRKTGVISIFRTLKPYTLDDSRLEKIGRYVTAMSTAIENARNYEQLKYTKDVLSALLESSASINAKSEMSDILQFTIDRLRHLFPSLGFGLVLHGIRPDTIEYAAFNGISTTEQQHIFANSAKLLWASQDNALSNWMKEIAEHEAEKTALNDDVHWSLFTIDGWESKIAGNLVVKGGKLSQQTKETIELFLKQVTSTIENKQLFNEMEKLAKTDTLTQTYNRFYFDKQLESSIARSHLFPFNFFSVVSIDINGLKNVNDNFGHPEGDMLIRSVANILLNVCRKSDIVCRIGGDEFVVICPNTNDLLANTLVSRIRERAAATSIKCRNDAGEEVVLPVQISIGVASSDNTPPTRVLKIADKNMYADKQAFYSTQKNN
ncbi:MAG: sensor domain-containing diguanylate cyclase [Hahellaceae bacterium]|nr:sensor domain-containing diguanylate cyclase [Hahellaceae bacterium]